MFYVGAEEALEFLVENMPPTRQPVGWSLAWMTAGASAYHFTNLASTAQGREKTIDTLLAMATIGVAVKAFQRARSAMRPVYEMSDVYCVDNGFAKVLTEPETKIALKLTPLNEGPRDKDGWIFMNGVHVPEIVRIPGSPTNTYFGHARFGDDSFPIEIDLARNTPDKKELKYDLWTVGNWSRGRFEVISAGVAINHHLAKHGGVRDRTIPDELLKPKF